MRALIPAGAVAALLFLLSTAAPAPAPVPYERIGNDLKLVLRSRMAADQHLEPGESPSFELSLVNRSLWKSHPVVLPGDGSEVGWREPYIYYTAMLQRADGSEVAVSPERYGRCGLFDRRWPGSAILLKLGDRHILEYWRPLLEFQQSGLIRLTTHYAYSGGRGPRSRSVVPKGHQLGLMRYVPNFELVSNPIAFEVVRSLELHLSVKSPIKACMKHRISDILQVELVNLSPNFRELADPSGYPWSQIQMELDATLGWRPSFDESPDGNLNIFWAKCRGLPTQLKAGGRTTLIGANSLDGYWEYPRPETVKLRAAFMPGSRTNRPTILSNWVEVTFE